MKQDKYIKYLLASFTSILIYIVSYIILNYILNLKIGEEFLVGMIIQVIFCKEIIIKIDKEKINKTFMFIIPFLLTLIIYKLDNFILHFCTFFIHIIVVAKLDKINIDKVNYFEILRNQWIILLVTIFLLSGGIDNIEIYLGRFYITLFVLTIILLRTVRSFQYGLVVKNEKIKSVGIAIFLVILCNDSLFIILFKLIKNTISTILSKLINLSSFIIYPIISVLSKSLDGYEGVVNIESYEDFPEVVSEVVSKSNPNIIIVLELIISVIIIYLIYLVIKKIKNRNESVINHTLIEEVIVREKINITSNKSILKKKRYTGYENKTIIKRIFYDIQFKMSKYNLYKDEDSATEVIDKICGKNSTEAKIASIYNKAKFSDEEIVDEEVLIVKEDFKKIKQKIKSRASSEIYKN